MFLTLWYNMVDLFLIEITNKSIKAQIFLAFANLPKYHLLIIKIKLDWILFKLSPN